ncbi:acyl-CoA carboxylase epsilon subunit [Streptomyces sp. NPDC051207]|uniref:acyl-CoA carboxylase epsilon subunit n=1 Tax=Streptomyces sp. NPDC051207 TaxID=3154641 RepID=UPI003434C7F8
MESAETVLRVERGRAGEEELAALTAVLLALRASDQRERASDQRERASDQGEPEPEATLGWNWWTSLKSYAPPTSWR